MSKSALHTEPGKLAHAAEQALGRASAHEDMAIGAAGVEDRAEAARPFGLWRAQGKRSASPLARAVQSSINGQIAQAGFFGVQIVAPRSIMACAKSPARSSGVISSVRVRITGLAAGIASSIENNPRDDALHIAVDDDSALAEGDGRDGGRRIRPQCQAARAGRFIRWKNAAEVGRDLLRAGVKVSRPAVIAKARHSFITSSTGAAARFANCRPKREKPLVIGLHRLHRRLLQHDLRQPDGVRIGLGAGSARQGSCGASDRTNQAAAAPPACAFPRAAAALAS